MTANAHDDPEVHAVSDDLAASAIVELERAAQADHETRLAVLEDVYRSLETHLDSAGSDALQ